MSAIAQSHPDTPLAVHRVLGRILTSPCALRRHSRDLHHLAPFVIGVRTRDGFDWYLACRICGWCSLPMSVKPTRRVCEVCTDLADGHANLHALDRVVAGAVNLGDVVIED